MIILVVTCCEAILKGYTKFLCLFQMVEKTIRPCLVELSEDPDVDVRFFATEALKLTDQAVMAS